jgi:hypothetical protein
MLFSIFENMKILVVILVLFVSFNCFSQNNKIVKKTIQLSGLLVNEDSLKPVTNATIKMLKTENIDYSYFFSVPTDENGFFILMACPGDVIGFKKDGYIDTSYAVPDTLKTNHYSIVQHIQNLKEDTKKIKASPKK